MKINLVPLLPKPAVMTPSMPVTMVPRWGYILTGNDIVEKTSLTATVCGELPVSVSPTLSVIEIESGLWLLFWVFLY